jgi:hypothetical protein
VKFFSPPEGRKEEGEKAPPKSHGKQTVIMRLK